ncbi:MAG: sigma-E processing peptidase SpoIIGA [Bacillota bacterium]
MVVYADVVFLINLAMDLLILLASARTAGVEVALPRVMAGACFGSAFSVLALLAPGSPLDTWWAKTLAGAVMVLVSFNPATPKLLAVLSAYFLGYSFLVAGATFAVLALFSTNSPVVRWWVLPAGGVLALGISQGARRALAPAWPGESVRVRIDIAGGTTECIGLVDTGNRLVDPLTGQPVIIVQSRVISQLFPVVISSLLEREEPDMVGAIQAAGELEGWRTRFRLIPYSTVGSTGVMVAVRVDWLGLSCSRGSWNRRNALVALSWRELSPDGSFAALIQPRLLDRAWEGSQ